MLRRSLLLLFFCCLLAFGQSSGGDTTAGMLNGRFWGKLGSQKVTFVVGVLEGIRIAHMMTELSDPNVAKNVYSSLLTEKFTFGEITSELDRLYADRANTLVPITMMLTHVKKIFTGTMTKAQLEEDIIHLRRIYNN